MSLAFRNLSQDRGRLAISIAGVALSVMLMLFIIGFVAGIYHRTEAYLTNASGSVVVLPVGSRNTVISGALLPASIIEAVTGVDGVAGVTSVFLVTIVPDLHGTREPVVLAGYDPALGGGPWNLARGREPRSGSEIVMDRALAGRHTVAIGDRITLGGQPLTVVGLSDDTSYLGGSYVFALKSAVEVALLAPGGASMLIVAPAEGVSPETLRDRLQEMRGVSVFLKRTVIANDKRLLGGVYNQPLFLMIGIAFAVGTLVVGVVIYTATVERQHEYGVLKAVGAANGVLYRIVTAQAVFAAGLGAVLGVGLAFGMGWLVNMLRPQFLVRIEPQPIALAFAAASVMALLAALLPAHAIARLAPADVFRR